MRSGGGPQGRRAAADGGGDGRAGGWGRTTVAALEVDAGEALKRKLAERSRRRPW